MNKEKSVLEEAIIQMKNLEQAVAENAKGILESTMKQEIKDLVKESLKEQDDEEIEDEDMEDEDMEDEDAEMETEDDMDMDIEDDDMDMDVDVEMGADAFDMEEPDMEFDDETIDLTDKPSSDVLKVYKLMTPEDEVIIVKDSNNNISLKDTETQKEYMIVGEGMDEDFYFDDEETEDDEFDFSSEDFETEDDEVVFEVEFDDEEDVEEDDLMESFKAKGKGMSKPKFKYDSKPNQDLKFPKQKEGTKGVGMGKGPKKDVYKKESPSFEGEFDKKPKKVETKEASRTLGSGKAWGKKGLPKPRTSPSHLKLESENQKELELLREKNEEYKKALNIFRDKINEVSVFNSNLAYVTRIFTEHSTSKQEKLNIIQRFDEVKTLKESKNLYRTIKDELSNTKSGGAINESIERTIEKTPSTGSAVSLIESKTYENPQFQRMKDLMSKLKK